MQIGPYTIQALPVDTDTKAIRKALMHGRDMLVRPAAEWEKFSWAEQRMLLHETATFVAPTEELIDFLDELIGDESAIEICCGNGYIGRELDIPITDGMAHNKTDVKLMYGMVNNPTIKYPSDVRKLEAQAAVRIFHPHTVIACYPAFQWEADKQIGASYGVDFSLLLSKVKRLVIVGNRRVYEQFKFMSTPHVELQVPGIITRSEYREDDRVWIFQNDN